MHRDSRASIYFGSNRMFLFTCTGASTSGQRRPHQAVHVNKRGVNDIFRDDFGGPVTLSSRMPPPAIPTSSGSSAMGPPPPPSSSAGNSVTTRYVVLQATSPTSSRGSVVSESLQQSSKGSNNANIFESSLFKICKTSLIFLL